MCIASSLPAKQLQLGEGIEVAREVARLDTCLLSRSCAQFLSDRPPKLSPFTHVYMIFLWNDEQKS